MVTTMQTEESTLRFSLHNPALKGGQASFQKELDYINSLRPSPASPPQPIDDSKLRYFRSLHLLPSQHTNTSRSVSAKSLLTQSLLADQEVPNLELSRSRSKSETDSAMRLSSAPIQIPLNSACCNCYNSHSSDEEMFDSDSESEQEMEEDDDDEFVPPHQMVARSYHSLELLRRKRLNKML
eukprot:GILJ01000871.1.p1 GENE.GILJ01000871.1~~GILJ01000871.1.p1  ORF type:complete len:182 (+),score=23.57 GILJ01000871.1:105-650(+)